jgi:hypothetical protein
MKMIDDDDSFSLNSIRNSDSNQSKNDDESDNIIKEYDPNRKF